MIIVNIIIFTQIITHYMYVYNAYSPIVVIYSFCACCRSDGPEMLQRQRPRTQLHSLVCRVRRPLHVLPHSGGSAGVRIGTGTDPERELLNRSGIMMLTKPLGALQVLQVFSVNPLNIAALDHAALPANLTDYYTGLVYQQDANFNPLL